MQKNGIPLFLETSATTYHLRSRQRTAGRHGGKSCHPQDHLWYKRKRCSAPYPAYRQKKLSACRIASTRGNRENWRQWSSVPMGDAGESSRSPFLQAMCRSSEGRTVHFVPYRRPLTDLFLSISWSERVKVYVGNGTDHRTLPVLTKLMPHCRPTWKRLSPRL